VLFPGTSGNSLKRTTGLPVLTAAFSYGFWFYSAADATPRFITVIEGTTLLGWYLTSGGGVTCFSSVSSINGASYFPGAATWNFLGLTYDPSGSGTLVRYRKTAAATALTASSFAGLFSGSATSVTIGNEADGTTPFNAQITSYKFFASTLTAEQMLTESRRFTPRTAGPFDWFPLLSEPQSNVDWSGNAHDLTKVGAMSTSRAAPQIPWSGAA
jgi:hypothetical protein